MNKNNFPWETGFTLDFDLVSGLSEKGVSTKRYLSQMKGFYYDSEAEAKLLESDPMVYEFYELNCPEVSGDLAFGTTIVYPGKVNDEYYMTKGHFHVILDTAEVYYTLSGRGILLCESPEGDVKLLEMKPGEAVYVPKRYAHRTINTGNMPLVAFFVFRGDAGHDYGTIEKLGYRTLVVDRDGVPTALPNPKWK